MSLDIENALPFYPDRTGKPLQGGQIYFGASGQNPVTNPITIYWDAAATQPAAQPVSVSNGLTTRNGTPARVYIPSAYSRLVLDANGQQVSYDAALAAPLRSDLSAAGGAAIVGFEQSGTGAVLRTVQDKAREIFSTKDVGAKGDGATDDTAKIQQTVSDLQASGVPSGAKLPAGNYVTSSPVTVEGNFNGGVTLTAEGAVVTSSQGGAAFQFGLYTTPAPEYRLYAHLDKVNLTGPGKAVVNSIGLYVNDTSDAYARDAIFKGFQYALRLDGGLISDFSRLTLRDSHYGLYATSTANFNPNSLTFTGLRIIENDLGVYTNNNPNGVINFFATEVEGNNSSGTAADGVKVTDHELAGNINYFGCHFESNPGQYNVYYKGNTSANAMVVIGSQLIAGAGEQLHVEQGRLTAIGSRITTGGRKGIVFGATASGTVIDCEADINGTLSDVLCIRQGCLGFGINPVGGDPVINMTSAVIAGAGNVAMKFANDTTIKNYYNTAGTRIAYETISNGADSVIVSTQAFGWNIAVNSSTLLRVGRSALSSIEPGSDNAVTCGSGSFRWSTVYAATGAINTSDARAKQQVRTLTDAERAVAVRVKGLLRAFKFNDAVAEKGDGARIHFGVVAQDVRDAFAAEGLDATQYGLFCYDQWDAVPERLDDEGNVMSPALPAGDRFGVRYEELLAFVLAAL